MCGLRLLVKLLLIVGALNWGFVGLFDYNPVQIFLGDTISRIVFIAVGLAGICKLVCLFKNCSSCGSGGSSCGCKGSGCGKDKGSCDHR